MSLTSTMVSVVIVVRNGERVVGHAIASVLAQSWQPGEIIVVDDGSEDETAMVVRSFGTSVQFLRSTRKGKARARNQGITAARGSAVAFLEAEDLWLREKLAIQVPVLRQARPPTLVFGHIELFESFCPRESRSGAPLSVSPQIGIIPSTLLVSRSVFDHVGMFDERWHVGDFVHWYARCVENRVPIEVVPQAVVRRRESASDRSSHPPVPVRR